MRYDSSGTLRFSPKDLITYLEGDFASWMDRLEAERRRDGADPASFEAWSEAKPDEDPELALAAARGLEHESRYLARLKAEGREVVEIDRDDAASTLAAMQRGVEIIFQATLEGAGLSGYPDFLIRVPGKSALGDWHYEPWDTKLARSAKPYFMIQLSAYAEMLEEIQGRRPATMVFVLGDGVEARYQVGDFYHYYRRLKASFVAFQDGWKADNRPFPWRDRTHGRWSGLAEEVLAAADHPSQIAGITRGQVRRLDEVGLTTLTDVARSAIPTIPRMQAHVWERLRQQAGLQLASRGALVPQWQVLPPTEEEPRRGLAQLPPADPGDVFFDLEGFPFAENGLEYLWGAVTVEAGSDQFHDWWAHDAKAERAAFEGFIDWVTARRQAHPGLHVYHYAQYEKTAIRRLMGQYATREEEVDDLLRGEVFVDLYQVVKQGLRVGTPSYSLKKIEQLYRPAREGEVTDAGTSVVEYQRWIDEGQPRSWEDSPILEGIRKYNEDDCVSTRQLRDWLAERQAESGIAYTPPRKEAPEEKEEPVEHPRAELAERLLARSESERETDPDRARVTELIAGLLQYHRREEKPMWWRMFDRHGATEDELFDDLDCLAGLERTTKAPEKVKHSFAYEYRYDPDQDTKFESGDKCIYAHDLDEKTEIVSIKPGDGLVEIKLSRKRTALEELSLIPDEYVRATVIEEAIEEFAQGWERGGTANRAVADLLARQSPRIVGHTGPVIPDGVDTLNGTLSAVRSLDRSVLCIQGPPGTGKTFTSAAAIVGLLREGRSIGVTSNSHRAVLNLLGSVKEAMAREGVSAPVYRVDDEDLGDEALGIPRIETSTKVAETIAGMGSVVVGGTAWVFARPELRERFDYLFVDEAGQVSLANVVGMGMGAHNIVLVGDQMQLAQPVKGSHPGESGSSSLEYRLAGHATIPPDLGIFLERSRRMHPDVCRFISEAVYEGRLQSHEVATGRSLSPGGDLPSTGAWWLPVLHEGCGQYSDEEVEQIKRAIAVLRGRDIVEADGTRRKLDIGDILVVAPFNMQVRRLQQELGPEVRVGTVDKFQGQEAEVVLVSMCASSRAEAPRGSAFLLSPNRINVAVSRARLLALVFGNPALLEDRCDSIEEMRRVNLLCRLPDWDGQG